MIKQTIILKFRNAQKIQIRQSQNVKRILDQDQEFNFWQRNTIKLQRDKMMMFIEEKQ
ncbi:unnamed protein product [Paramecium sonneborni]|uniref:Uncharacterized protein n=1 Tax=Paramecium sonneborni TaxID=65129 RepID=A0A8S1Q7I4_9CILI|nr:unnamed protein product [Paramecium sonneborni]